MRKSANYPGIFQVYPGFVRYTRKILGFLPILLILAPKQPQTRLRALKNDDFHGVSPRKLEGAVGKRAGNTERKSGRVREETCIQPNLDGILLVRCIGSVVRPCLGARTLELVRELEPFLFSSPRPASASEEYQGSSSELRTNRERTATYLFFGYAGLYSPWLPTRGLVRLDASGSPPVSPILLSSQHARGEFVRSARLV